METRGERIKRLREAKGLNQVELAHKLKVTKAAVSKWEANTSPNMDLAVFFELARVLQIDPQELATGHPSRPQTVDDIPDRRLDLIRSYGRLPQDIRAPIRALIETLSVAQNERYAKWSHEEGERAKKRDTKRQTA